MKFFRLAAATCLAATLAADADAAPVPGAWMMSGIGGYWEPDSLIVPDVDAFEVEGTIENGWINLVGSHHVDAFRMDYDDNPYIYLKYIFEIEGKIRADFKQPEMRYTEYTLWFLPAPPGWLGNDGSLTRTCKIHADFTESCWSRYDHEQGFRFKGRYPVSFTLTPIIPVDVPPQILPTPIPAPFALLVAACAALGAVGRAKLPRRGAAVDAAA